MFSSYWILRAFLHFKAWLCFVMVFDSLIIEPLNHFFNIRDIIHMIVEVGKADLLQIFLQQPPFSCPVCSLGFHFNIIVYATLLQSLLYNVILALEKYNYVTGKCMSKSMPNYIINNCTIIRIASFLSSMVHNITAQFFLGDIFFHDNFFYGQTV